MQEPHTRGHKPRLKNSKQKSGHRHEKQVKVNVGVYPLNWRKANIEFRRAFIKAALELHDNNISHTADALGIVRRTLQLLMEIYGLRTKNGVYVADSDKEPMSNKNVIDDAE